jgi:hypothetical protein
MKTVELFSIRNLVTDEIVRNQLSQAGVDQDLRTLEALGIASDFSVESEGHFTYREVTTQYNSMSQADIDNGGDNDPYELTQRIYIK